MGSVLCTLILAVEATLGGVGFADVEDLEAVADEEVSKPRVSTALASCRSPIRVRSAPATVAGSGIASSVRVSTRPARASRIIPTAVLSACSIAKTGRCDSMAWNTFDGV